MLEIRDFKDPGLSSEGKRKRDEGGMLRWLTPGRTHGLPGGECMG